jgi:hypothetical protein
MPIKSKDKKTSPKPQKTLAELMPVKIFVPAGPYAAALARADAVIRSSGVCRGIIPADRASHESAWQNLLTEDQVTRDQILELKAKENQILGVIRDRVAENLMETMDAAIEQGILAAPEEV